MSIKDWSVTGNSKYLSNLSVTFKEEFNGTYLFRLRVYNNETFTHSKASILNVEIFIFSNKISFLQFNIIVHKAEDERYNCHVEYFQRTVDLCHISQNIANNLVIGPIYKSIVEKLSFPIKCPYKPGVYETRNVSIAIGSAFTTKLFKGFYCIKFTILGKSVKSKTLERIYEFKTRGYIELWVQKEKIINT